jgi:hypothetical protein
LFVYYSNLSFDLLMPRFFKSFSLMMLAVWGFVLTPSIHAAEKSALPVNERKKEKALRDNDRAAQEAMARDARLFGNKDFRDLEAEYQVINDKYRDPGIKELLDAFIKKWTKGGNRVGCATLYLAQKSGGAERERLLRQCIAQYDECYFLNGCQVGGLARVHLWNDLKATGKADEAAKLLEEIKAKYALANDHQGNLLIELVETSS